MIDLPAILDRIHDRLRETGTTAAEVSAKATDSKDTIRNWTRAIEADRKSGTQKASATTIKLNQIESVLGIELAQNAVETKILGSSEISKMLRKIDGLPEDAIVPLLVLIEGYLQSAGQLERHRLHDQSVRASRRREEVPS